MCIRQVWRSEWSNCCSYCDNFYNTRYFIQNFCLFWTDLSWKWSLIIDHRCLTILLTEKFALTHMNFKDVSRGTLWNLKWLSKAKLNFNCVLTNCNQRPRKWKISVWITFIWNHLQIKEIISWLLALYNLLKELLGVLYRIAKIYDDSSLLIYLCTHRNFDVRVDCFLRRQILTACLHGLIFSGLIRFILVVTVLNFITLSNFFIDWQFLKHYNLR